MVARLSAFNQDMKSEATSDPDWAIVTQKVGSGPKKMKTIPNPSLVIQPQ